MLRKWIQRKIEVAEVTVGVPGLGITFRPAPEETPASPNDTATQPVAPPAEKPARATKKTPRPKPEPPPIAFEEALALLKRETFAEEMRRALRDLAPRLRLTSAQAEEILRLFRFSEDRLAALKILRPRLVDPENALSLVAHFPAADDRAVVRKLLG